MGELFLYREKNNYDKDCCAYIADCPMRFECGHYFGSPTLMNAYYSGGTWKDYDEIETVLSEEEYSALQKFKDDICALGYGIEEGDERYQIGMELCENIQPIYDVLKSKEAQAFYQNIIAEEKLVVAEEYNLTSEEVDEIFDNYPDYQDRGIVRFVYENVEELGHGEFYSYGYSEDPYLTRYVDFEKMGYDLLEERTFYYELSDGKCVVYNM